MSLHEGERKVRVPAFGWPEKKDARDVLREALGDRASGNKPATEPGPRAEEFYDNAEKHDAVLKWHCRK